MNLMLFFLLFLIAALTGLPWNLSRPNARVILLLPLLGLITFGLCELTMHLAIPAYNVPIRLDLLFSVPAILFICCMGLVRLGIFWGLRLARSGRTGRAEQVGGTVLSILVTYLVAAWFLK